MFNRGLDFPIQSYKNDSPLKKPSKLDKALTKIKKIPSIMKGWMQ